MQWKAFAAETPQLAEFGALRLKGRVAYLATIRRDSSPRIHPVTPFLGQGHLFVFIHRQSPKGHDLRRNGRFALHSSVDDSSGTSGEFLISGRAVPCEDPDLRQVAVMIVGHPVPVEQQLFELYVARAMVTEYVEESGSRRAVHRRWSRS